MNKAILAISILWAVVAQAQILNVSSVERLAVPSDEGTVMQAVGGIDSMIDPECKDKDLLALITYTAESGRAQKVMENQGVLRQPIVRNGKQATVGYAPDVWKTWQ